ncbi:ZIP family metal transporter [Candidatus Woesebacteria bacterium]|nr:ZIP family metal transporter [Candidatus Woesebacteria bacterium]
MTLFYIFSVTFISSLISLLGSFFLARKKEWPKKFILQLTSFASGVLLATALLHLAPEAVETLDAKIVFTVIFISIIVFFVLERLMLWHHHHEEDDCCDPHPSAWFITFGDSIHNFLDGVLIAGAFLVNPSLGLLTAFAVSAHEIPQEIADFSIMVAGGMERKKALLLNLISAMSAVVGALVTYFFAFSIEGISPYLIAFSAGMFLYIALSDLIPQLHNHGISDSKQKWNQMALFFIGVTIIAGISFFIPEVH